MCSKLFLPAVFALVNLWWSHVKIEIPYLALFPLLISHPNPTNTGNPAPTHNWNSRFSPLFSAQIPNITAKRKPNPASRQTYWGPSSKYSISVSRNTLNQRTKRSQIFNEDISCRCLNRPEKEKKKMPVNRMSTAILKNLSTLWRDTALS